MESMQAHEKIYVAIGNEMQEEETLLTLNWVLKRWENSLFSIFILFITCPSSYDIVFTPFGKLPASAVSDDKLKILRKCEQERIDHLLSKLISFCGKIKVKVHNIDIHGEPAQNTIVNLIMEHRITKLVLGMATLTSSSGSKSAISGSFYVHRNKPDFCELYILCLGKLVVLKEENGEGYMEDEQGVIVAKLKQKPSLRGWLGKMLHHGYGKTPICPSSRSTATSLESDSPVSRDNNQWEYYEKDIEDYLKELLMLESNSKEDNNQNVEESVNTPSEQNIADCIEDTTQRIEALKKEIQNAQEMIEFNKIEAKVEVDKQAKASWAICLCNHRTEELEAHITEEITVRNDITKEIDNTKEQLYEIQTDVQESKNKLSSLLELQSELSSKLQVSSLAKLGAEAQLENAASTRAELIREIEELRKQRDIFQRRIEFCKEKDAIGLATRTNRDQPSCSYREYNANEIILATDNFATYRRLTCGGDWTSVYKGQINRLSVAIKVLDPEIDFSQEMLLAKVNILASIRHPHITSFLGFCLELKCLIFEYMHSGCLRDVLFSRTKSRTLEWHHRIQIATQVSLGLSFIHLAKPRPLIYTTLNPSYIFLDRNLVAKIHPFELTSCYDEVDLQADIRAFGDLLLQLLTGRNWASLDCELMMVNKQAILDSLDDNAGDWPLNFVEDLVSLAIECQSVNFEREIEPTMSSVVEKLNELKKKADDIIVRRECHIGIEDGLYCGEESIRVPPNFLCPIYQVVMDNPHIASDGHSYELEAIEEWLRMGHDTSPVTNQKLKHRHLIPNKNLRFMIEDWRSSTS